MGTVARTTIAGLGAALCLGLMPPVAQALVQSATAAGDPQTTYTVSGDTVTIQSTNLGLLRFVRGTEVQITCASRQETRMWNGYNHWGSHASSMTIRYRHTVTSLGPCWTAEVGRKRVAPEFFAQPIIVSQAAFTPYWRRQWGWVAPPGRRIAWSQLTLAWTGIEESVPDRFKNAKGLPLSLPPVTDIVRLVDRLPRIKAPYLRYARTLAGATQQGVTYVIARGSGPRQIELAVLGYDGRLYVLRATVGVRPRAHFGPV